MPGNIRERGSIRTYVSLFSSVVTGEKKLPTWEFEITRTLSGS